MAKRSRQRMKAATGEYRVGPETIVTFSYELFDAEGEAIETSHPNEPLTILFGYGQIAPAVENVLDGARPGDARRARLSAEEAFGRRDPEAILEVDPSDFPEDVKEGDEFAADGESGPLTLKVLEVAPDRIVVDTNHPLADQAVELDMVIEEVRPATSAEIAEATQVLLESGGPAGLIPAGRLLVRGEQRN